MINNKTTVQELLNSDADLKPLIDIIIPSNRLNDIEVKDFMKLEFQKVMDILALISKGEILEVISLLTNLEQKEILKINANDFICFVKWINEQAELISNVMQSLNVDDFDEHSIMLQASGIETLNKYSEVMIYYNISQNPCHWDSIGSQPFSYIFTKLSIDKDIAQINKKYSEILKQKK